MEVVLFPPLVRFFIGLLLVLVVAGVVDDLGLGALVIFCIWFVGQPQRRAYHFLTSPL